MIASITKAIEAAHAPSPPASLPGSCRHPERGPQLHRGLCHHPGCDECSRQRRPHRSCGGKLPGVYHLWREPGHPAPRHHPPEQRAPPRSSWKSSNQGHRLPVSVSNEHSPQPSGTQAPPSRKHVPSPGPAKSAKKPQESRALIQATGSDRPRSVQSSPAVADCPVTREQPGAEAQSSRLSSVHGLEIRGQASRRRRANIPPIVGCRSEGGNRHRPSSGKSSPIRPPQNPTANPGHPGP